MLPMARLFLFLFSVWFKQQSFGTWAFAPNYSRPQQIYKPRPICHHNPQLRSLKIQISPFSLTLGTDKLRHHTRMPSIPKLCAWFQQHQGRSASLAAWQRFYGTLEVIYQSSRLAQTLWFPSLSLRDSNQLDTFQLPQKGEWRHYLLWDFFGGPVVRTQHFHCWGRGFNPWLLKQDPISHTAWPEKKKCDTFSAWKITLSIRYNQLTSSLCFTWTHELKEQSQAERAYLW